MSRCTYNTCEAPVYNPELCDEHFDGYETAKIERAVEKAVREEHEAVVRFIKGQHSYISLMALAGRIERGEHRKP